jgi:hypothetical protein
MYKLIRSGSPTLGRTCIRGKKVDIKRLKFHLHLVLLHSFPTDKKALCRALVPTGSLTASHPLSLVSHTTLPCLVHSFTLKMEKGSFSESPSIKLHGITFQKVIILKFNVMKSSDHT